MEMLPVPVWAWAVTIAVLAALAGTDLLVSARRSRPPGLGEAAAWSAAAIALAASFGALLAVTAGGSAAGQFYAGWLTEYSLSLDNLVVFVLLISASTVPRRYHDRVLMLGIFLALALRAGLIAAGAAALARFGWVEYLFGAFLFAAAARMAMARHSGEAGAGPRPSPGAAALRRLLPVAAQGEGGRLVTRAGGRRLATPLLALVIAIGVTDVLFALDSIPAIFGLTRDPFLVFSANLFALLGLRHLYFLVGGLLGRLAHLTAGLAVVLAFIGVKLVSGALSEQGVTALGPVPVPHIGTVMSLAVIAAVIATVTATSLLAGRRRASDPGGAVPLAGPRGSAGREPARAVGPAPAHPLQPARARAGPRRAGSGRQHPAQLGEDVRDGNPDGLA